MEVCYRQVMLVRLCGCMRKGSVPLSRLVTVSDGRLPGADLTLDALQCDAIVSFSSRH